jgi:hypothetical protein
MAMGGATVTPHRQNFIAMRFIILSLFLLAQLNAISQIVPEFSDLSSRSFYSKSRFSSLLLDDGLLYYNSSPDNPYSLFKVDFNAEIIDSAITSNNGMNYSGVLYSHNNRLFLVGQANPAFVNWDQVFRERRRAIIEFDSDLNIIGEHLYDIMPYSTGYTLNSSYSLASAEGFGFVQPLDGMGLINDTMWMLREYVFVDTITFAPLATRQRLEKVGLNGMVYDTVDIGYYLQDYLSSIVLDSRIYVYAASSECCGSALIDATSASQFDLAGNFVQKLSLAPPGASFDPNYSTSGVRLGDRIYSSYADGGFFGVPCETAVIDVRDLDFNRLHIAKVPDCGMAPTGTKCYAVQEGAVFFMTRNGDGDIGLYKYDLALNLIWKKTYDFEQPHFGIAINSMPDGGVIMECFEGEEILKLYKVAPNGDIVSSTRIPINMGVELSVFPNPFTESITIEGALAQKLVAELYDSAGKLVFKSKLETNTPFNLSQGIASGAYFLVLRNAETMQLVGTEKLVKR